MITMKNKKQILCVLLAVVLTISTFAPMSVFAFVGVDEIEVELLQEGSFDPIVSTSSLAVSAISGDTSSVEAEIYNQLLNCATSFNLTLYKVSIDDFYLLYCDVVNNNPDLFYVSSNVQYNYYQTSKTVSTVKPQYAMTSSEIADAKVIFNEGVSKALSVVDDSMSDLQKALVLHDYICDLAEYPDISTEDKNIYHSAYGFFYDQKVVCAGYTLAYSYLLSMVGIECEQVSSTAMVHAWNAVNIDGNWYNVDLTFDDIGFYNSNMNVE
jgi:transglutaminase/protease-like cytokinesis protein 3